MSWSTNELRFAAIQRAAIAKGLALRGRKIDATVHALAATMMTAAMRGAVDPEIAERDCRSAAKG